jgi:hypothetical protein
MRRNHLATSFLLLLLLAGCQLSLVAFTGPGTAAINQVFSLSLTVNTASVPGNAGAVLQLPLGVAIVGEPSTTFVRDEPALLATYTPEPGHYLASWTASSTQLTGNSQHQVMLRAPATATTLTFKVALAGRPTTQAWQANAPAGITQFAQITAAAHVVTVQVVATPDTDFGIDAFGLPFGFAQPAHFGVVLHDLDGDGFDDLATPGRVFLRHGDQWFESSLGLVGGGQFARIAAGDFDGDGFVDLVYGDGRVFFGNGGTAWTPGPQLGAAQQTLGVAAGDFDGDGRADVVLGGYYQNRLRAFRGNANRTFTSADTGLPNGPTLGGHDVLLQDVTGDGHLDIVWDRVYAGDGLGNWSVDTGVGGNSGVGFGVAAGDLDGDGAMEIVHANANQGFAVHRHLGGNTWALAGNLQPPGRTAQAIALLDHDRDGRLDLVFGFQDTINGLQLWRNLGGLQFALATNSGLPPTTSSYVQELTVGDWNGDTWPDLGVAFFSIGVAAFQNLGGGLSPFGARCTGLATPAPDVVGLGQPTLGNAAFGVQLQGAAPGDLCLLWLGTSRAYWNGLRVLPLDLAPLGASGCTVWTDPAAFGAGVADANGALLLPLPIPNVPSLRLVTLFAQGAIAAPGANALGLAFSGGLAIRIP